MEKFFAPPPPAPNQNYESKKTQPDANLYNSPRKAVLARVLHTRKRDITNKLMFSDLVQDSKHVWHVPRAAYIYMYGMYRGLLIFICL